jgi:hypothetical protein
MTGVLMDLVAVMKSSRSRGMPRVTLASPLPAPIPSLYWAQARSTFPSQSYLPVAPGTFGAPELRQSWAKEIIGISLEAKLGPDLREIAASVEGPCEIVRLTRNPIARSESVVSENSTSNIRAESQFDKASREGSAVQSSEQAVVVQSKTDQQHSWDGW